MQQQDKHIALLNKARKTTLLAVKRSVQSRKIFQMFEAGRGPQPCSVWDIPEGHSQSMFQGALTSTM